MEHSTKSMRSNPVSWKHLVMTLETRIFYKLMSLCAESSSKSGLCILAVPCTRLLNCNPDSGDKMQETWPSGEIYNFSAGLVYTQ